MLMTESGMTMLVKLEHLSNANFPICLTELGMSMLVKLVQ